MQKPDLDNPSLKLHRAPVSQKPPNALGYETFGLRKTGECWLAYLNTSLFICVAEDAPEGRPEEQIHRGEGGGVPKSERADLRSGCEFHWQCNYKIFSNDLIMLSNMQIQKASFPNAGVH